MTLTNEMLEKMFRHSDEHPEVYEALNAERMTRLDSLANGLKTQPVNHETRLAKRLVDSARYRVWLTQNPEVPNGQP